ncbi:carbon starvation protein [Actinocorallia herbida]|uniref:Carbon starvation protein n=1 Tax=Actinocorallia herbida TaxID=58109 RepID=A0A3N1D0A5_9ACTN|nr:carbon starvation CstA family protein [Actinocorallia herbida]ROO86936.1 carbon starvation protein [Actinocorallia herbida]
MREKAVWVLVGAGGALAWTVLAVARGERVSAAWILFAALASYAIAYRFYARFVTYRVLRPDDTRATPAESKNNGIDFHPTDRRVLFGHHFAAIAGAGPLVGPVLAAQWGYLPGTLWIIVGVVFAGAVQDLVVLFFSMRRGGRSLGQMAKDEIGPVGGVAALVGALSIMVILLAVLALVVVNALAHSPWGAFSITMTIPIALLMGFYLRYLRYGRVLRASAFGAVLLVLAVAAGSLVADSRWADAFTWSPETLTFALVGYGFVASVLPVWMLLAPRDYLSAFMKIGVVAMLAAGILVALPDLRTEAFTSFARTGDGPVVAGALFPFVFITIACGALSGFHALVSSGTTPKLLEKESQVRVIGYGGMLTESFVAVMALIAACVIDPGLYFAMNMPASVLGPTLESASQAVAGVGFTISPEQLARAAESVGETTLVARTGGAPTLAVGIADIFASVGGAKAFWYHFAVMFEALFILTTVDAGTRIGRFMLQDTVGNVWRRFGDVSWKPGVYLSSAVVVAAWGWFLWAGVKDPLGGINQLFPLFGIANQLLAAIALIVCTTLLIKSGRARHAWVTLVPLAWDVAVTLTAVWQKVLSGDPRIGFFAQRDLYQDALDAGKTSLGSAGSVDAMEQVVLNSTVDGVLAAFFALVVIVVLADAVRVWLTALRRRTTTTTEDPYVASDLWAPSGLLPTRTEREHMKTAP